MSLSSATAVCPIYLGKKRGHKDDARDAIHLAFELRCNHVAPVFHEDKTLSFGL